MPLVYPDPAITPTSNARSLRVKTFKASRTDTTATVRAMLRKDAVIVGVMISANAVSDAGTTATLSIGTTTSANEIVNGQSVLTGGIAAGAQVLPTLASGSVLGGVGLTADTPIYVKYAETGTASSTGSWTITLLYIDT